MMDTAVQPAWGRGPPSKPPGPGPGAVFRRPPGTGGGRLLNGGARVSPGRRLSAAASLPLLLQDPDEEEDEAPSLNNILDAVPGLEVPDDEVAPSPRPRRPPTPPPRTTPLRTATPTSSPPPTPTYCSDLYYCKPWPAALGERPELRRTSPRQPRPEPRLDPLPPPPRLPDHFDEKQYLANRQLRRRSHHQLEDGCPLQQWSSFLDKQPPPPPPRAQARRGRVPPARSQSLRTPRPPPYILRQESPARLCPSRKGAATVDTSPSPCRTDPACWTPPPPPTADSPLEPLPPIDLAVGGEPVGRVRRFLRAFHRELGGRDPPHAPPWAPPLPPGTTAPQRMDPAVCILTGDTQRVDIRLEQILSPVRTADGGVLEAPRRVLVEAGPAMGKTTLALRLLAAWADGAPWIPPDVTLAFLVPLRELRGNTLAAYLGKQLLPKSAVPANFDKIWRTIMGLEERLLFVLDGYDEAVRGYPGVPGGREALGDALDLLEGRLLKEARVVLTCGSGWAHEVASSMQRRVLLSGLQWPQVESLSRTFFNDDDMADRFLDALAASEDTLQPLARAPLGWMALCSLFQDVQDLPEDPLQLHQALFRCVVRRSLARRGQTLLPPVSPALSDIPPHSRKVLADLGRLALVAMKDDRVMYTDNELRVHCGSAAGVASLGFLCRGLNFGRAAASRRAMEFYTPVFRSMAEFLAAYYMASVASYANILRRDLQLLPGLSEALSAGLGEQTGGPAETVLLFLLGLLGRRGHLVLGQFSPLDATPRSVFPLLRAAGPSEDNVDAACRLLGAAAGPGPDQGVQATVHCRELELEGWACVLRTPSCTLASLELVVAADGDGRLEPLFSALSANRSVRSVRVSTLLGHELSAHQLHRLAKQLHAVLSRARTHAFELVVACLEESAHDRFQCLVDALCTGLRSPSCAVARLLVDINLNCAQLQQLLSALRGSAVRTLQLPHLGCGSAGLRALTQHLRAHHAIDALSLAGSWGARNHGASESGGSMGSGGSGSCFSSLPRGALGLHGSLSRPATLPRQPLAAHILGLGPGPTPGGGATDSGYGSADTKRGSDSLLWRGQATGALPVCDVASHAGSGFHDVFDAIRDASCQLRNLNVSKCLLSPGDATCLGAAVRGGSLTALRLEGAARLWEVLPALLALAADPPLQLLDASSPRLSLPDGPAQQVFTALAKNANLRLLSLDGWTFRFEEEATLRGLLTLLSRTGIRDLSLSGCRLHCAGTGLGVGRSDAELQGMLLSALAASAPDLPASLACTELLFLRLAGLQVWVRDRVALRGPQLLPFLRGLGSLRELDLSAEREDAAGPGTPGPGQPGPLVIDDKALASFWAGLAESLRSLQTLHIAHWRLRLDDPERTLRAVAKSMRSCPLVCLRADGLVACDANRVPLEHLFLQTASANLCCLGRLGLSGVTLSPGQATALGRHIRDRFPGASLSLQVANVASASVCALMAALQDGGKVDVSCLAGSPPQLRVNRVVSAPKARRFRTRFASLRD
ncbi:uncharacterized protein LOC113203118 isoform X2 [Frankliniella occidentalis]|uniref:Uncharacterized protein LOC113203118 isoform X2 n=1 Tax=Frankliniella occidentalis TaxID=133901 RepID=A0A9C6U4G5_FRAOC|nr:uncharacterized protein LOC113203118 isoform X2 [Frankliniella occidentalis]